MNKELEVVARRKAELERRYAELSERGQDTAKLEAEARQLLAYEQALRASLEPAAAAAAPGDAPTILCCNCGVLTEVNDSRLCLSCFEERVAITSEISEVNSINFCKTCERYEHRPRWLAMQWESKELLALCLRRIKKPKHLRLVDASFIWTEPHSRRIRLSITVEGEVDRNVLVRQAREVTFVIAHKQCEDCCRSVTPHLWVSNVQVRQRSSFKRSMLYLEQLILKNQAHREAQNIVDMPDGLDFRFMRPPHAQAFAHFVRQAICCKVFPIATQLVSHDANCNTYSNKYTQIIELCPVNREDLVFVSKKLSQQQFGGAPQLLLCDRLSSGIRLIDPFSGQVLDLDAEKFFRLAGLTTAKGASSGGAGGYEAGGYSKEGTIRTILSPTRKTLQEFLVLSAQLLTPRACQGRRLERAQLAELELCRCSDLGKQERYIRTVTHLGGRIQDGDIVLCYDLATANIPDNDDELTQVLANMPQDVIVVRKQTLKQQRVWEFRNLPRELRSAAPSVAQHDREMIERDIDELAAGIEALAVS